VRGERSHLAERPWLLHQAPITAHPEWQRRQRWWRRNGLQDHFGSLAVPDVRARVHRTAAAQVGRRWWRLWQRRWRHAGNRIPGQGNSDGTGRANARNVAEPARQTGRPGRLCRGAGHNRTPVRPDPGGGDLLRRQRHRRRLVLSRRWGARRHDVHGDDQGGGRRRRTAAGRQVGGHGRAVAGQTPVAQDQNSRGGGVHQRGGSPRSPATATAVSVAVGQQRLRGPGGLVVWRRRRKCARRRIVL